MAAYLEHPNQTIIGYGNKVLAANISSIVLTSATAATGFPVDNLKYEDAHRILKVDAAPTGDPIIDITFTGSHTFDCAGIVNHNLISRGYTGVNVQYSGSFTNVGSTVNFPGTSTTDGDFLLRFEPQTSNRWRFVLDRSTPWPSFYIGMLFLGRYYLCPNGPEDGGITRSYEASQTIYRSAGAAKHVLSNGARYDVTHELLFGRITGSQNHEIMDTIVRSRQGGVIAIVPPDEALNQMPLDNDAHIFGRVRGMRSRRRVGAPVRYDLTLDLEAAK